MKRYEKLGIDLATKEGFREAIDICKRDYNKDDRCCYCEYAAKCLGEGNRKDDTDCYDCTADYLFEEIKTKKVKRWKTYNGDFDVALGVFRFNFCNRLTATLGNTILVESFVNWLMEEIEVEVEVTDDEDNCR